jgi:hypothetical protein
MTDERKERVSGSDIENILAYLNNMPDALAPPFGGDINKTIDALARDLRDCRQRVRELEERIKEAEHQRDSALGHCDNAEWGGLRWYDKYTTLRKAVKRWKVSADKVPLNPNTQQDLEEYFNATDEMLSLLSDDAGGGLPQSCDAKRTNGAINRAGDDRPAPSSDNDE